MLSVGTAVMFWLRRLTVELRLWCDLGGELEGERDVGFADSIVKDGLAVTAVLVQG